MSTACPADPGRYVLFNPSGMDEYTDVFWLVDLFEDRYAAFYACSWPSLKEDVELANRKGRPIKDAGYMWNQLTPDELEDHDEEGWLREQFKFGLLKCEREAKSNGDLK